MGDGARKDGREIASQSLGGRPAEAPLVSIVLVFFRGREELAVLLDNLRRHRLQVQDPREAEVVVIDGGSTDGTVELLRESGDVVDTWLSEPDAGIYDAMNKGVAAARGEYVLHLNAGDGLRHLPVAELRQCLAQGVDVAAFGVLVDGQRVFKPRLGLRSRIANTWHHQGTFYRRAAHLGYDPSYRVYGDFDHNERLRRSGCSVRLFPEAVVADHASGGASVAGVGTASLGEVWRVVRANAGLGWVPVSYAWMHLYLAVRWLRRRIGRHHGRATRA